MHPLQNRRVRLDDVCGNARVGAPFNIVKLTAALYYKHLADKLIYSLPPGFDLASTVLSSPLEKQLVVRSPERCVRVKFNQLDRFRLQSGSSRSCDYVLIGIHIWKPPMPVLPSNSSS